ncbi:MAG: M48 family peptidase [Acidobacteriaceae bacterium]|nr:M48 family peptidase [Acidobacteriaceae bacterium]
MGKMQVESALLFETVEQIYARVFRMLKPRTPLPRITVVFRRYANANSRIRLEEGQLRIDISDLLEGAPAPIQEALAFILISKLFGKVPDRRIAARYRRYLNRADVRRTLHLVKQERGRKAFQSPHGRIYDLCAIFDELNLQYFHGLMAQPQLGWSLKPSRTTLGHWDPSHNAIIITNLLDSEKASELILRFVMYHEMLHLRYPTEHRGARRCVHTSSFKEAEKRFDGFEKAKSELKAFVESAEFVQAS